MLLIDYCNVAFPKSLLKTLKESIDKRVSAYGEISYNKNGVPQKIKITELKILSEEGLPSWEDVRGILND